MDRSLEQKYIIHRSLELKISEVKNVFTGEKQQNTYCTIHINDDEVKRTPTVYNNTSPIFSEHFEFNPLIPNFNQLKIMVWSDINENNDKNLNNEDDNDSLSFTIPSSLSGDKALGQITFPLGFLKSGAFQKEQWFVLQPTFDNINKYNVTGDIRIEVSHTLNPNKTHRFEINIKQANDLLRDNNGSLPDPYVACYLLPDLEGKTAQLTTVKKNTINPVFNSKVVYNVENVTENLEINVSIWNWNKLSSNEFLGHCFVSLSDIPVNMSLDKRYTLLSKPARIFHSIKNKGKGNSKSKKRFTMVDGDIKINHRQFIQRLQRSDQKDNVPTTKRSHRLLDTKFYSISFCGHCGGIIWVTKTHLKCGNCKLSSERENAALSLIRIQTKYDNLFNCIKSLIEIEIMGSESILNAIFAAEQSLPKDWRMIFSFIQKKVIEKFPTEYNARLTSIAGFIFLRFFAPAILGPKLFGLIRTYVNERSTRTFTLLAKVIQTLANLSDFNEKELYMCPLNDYINAKLPAMKKYLNDICNEDVESNYSEELMNPLSDQLIGYECSKLLRYFTNIESKLIESITSEILNEERLRKKKASEDLTGKMSTLTISSEKTAINHSAESSYAQEPIVEEDKITKSNRNSNISLLNDENIKYISEYYKNNNMDYTDKSKNDIKNIKTIYKPSNEDMKKNESSTDTMVSSENSQVSLEDKKKMDRSKVLSMLNHIPKVGGVDFNYLNTVNGGTGGKNVPPSINTQKGSHDTIVASSSPFDSTSRRVSKSPFDTSSSPFSSSTKKTAKSPFDETASPFDTRKTSLSPYDETRKASIASPTSPFDMANKKTATTNPVSPFDNQRRSNYGNRYSISSPFESQTRASSSASSSSPFDTSRRISVPNSVNIHDKNNSNKNKSIINPLEANRMSSSINASCPDLPIDNPKNPFNRRLSNVSEADSTTSSRKTSYQYEDLIPSIPHRVSTQDCNEFEQAQGHIDPLNPLSVTQTNNPLDQEETIDIPESEINKEIYAKINKNIKYCWMCRMQILSEYITFDNERLYHAECFRCQRCDDILKSDNCYKKDTMYYCKNCYLFEEGYCCNECEEIIEGQAININGKLYHQDCFVCNACGMKLDKQYLAIEGRPYCKKDYLKFKGYMCGICGEFIENEFITIFDRKYHINCKKCILCGETLINKSFFSLPQDPYEVYCEEHKIELCTCHKCHLPIDDQMIRTAKNPTSYHIHCFKCTKCDKSLQDLDYFEKDQEIYCRNCYIELYL
ncbi:hypothetical protein LY90DRAFT_700708 [Neocallimastix californiae]|uniref:Rho GTPase activation protein n=1 Tax=Neocallimastix californiae TaxID=1754190 RepID=A0A1Y2E2J6_9FUNG|nr:hypothetical protein LY90DRAFT_700708 [Neocallimastix californiae]|eukprot:ORY65729.1 hypothetical protein LY90DRAFT_700708 [Neocallimastix californiae]